MKLTTRLLMSEGPLTSTPKETVHFSRFALKRTIKAGNRHTPYNKTPFTRRLTCSTIRSTKTSLPNQNLAHLKEFLNKTWKVYRMSPLFKFKTDPSFLKKYRRLLALHLETETSRTIIDPENLKQFDVSLSYVAGIKINSDEPEALRFIVKVKHKDDKDSEAKILLLALLCSVNNNPDDYLNENFIHFPIVLIKGFVQQIELLFSFLKNQFDCCIVPMRFPPHELSWMLAMWAGVEAYLDKKSKAVQLIYALPSEIKDLNKITVVINSQDCKTLWRSIHDKDSDEFTKEEVTAFIKSVELHLKRHFRINFSSMYLTVIGTPVALVENNGRLKIYSIRSFHRILRHITELIVEEIQY